MKKTVLFINGHLDTGGCERSLVDVLKNIDYEKYEVDLLLLERTGDYFEEVPEDVNIKLYSLDHAFGSLIPCFVQAIKKRDWFSLFFRIEYMLWKKANCHCGKWIKNLFGELKKSYDVIIAYRPGICTELAAFVFDGKKKVSWWHHGAMNISGENKKSLHEAYKKMDSVVAVSTGSLSIIAENFPDMKQKMTVIPNMIIPCELYKKARLYTPDEFQGESFYIVSVGRMSSEKNMSFCPQIAMCLKRMGFDFKWALIGDGEDRERISNMIREFGLQDHMIMLGRKANPYPYISAADIMIHPSLVESQGITILESMALSTPVIAVASEGPKEFIVTNENGYLVNPDTEEIVQLVKTLYLQPERRKEIAKNALATVRKFEPERIMKYIGRIMEV